MSILRPISIFATLRCLMLTASAATRANVPDAAAARNARRPPASRPPKPQAETARTAKASAPRSLPRSPNGPPKLPTPTAAPAPAPDNPNVDLAYGAYQRGQYHTAFNLATKRAHDNDPKAMTLLGELYSNGLGVKRDDAKAAEWYKRAAERGDREAMFALA